jgi:hypothetical protein
MNMKKKTIKNKVDFINSSQSEGLSPSCIALLVIFEGFGTILCHSDWFLSALFFSDFQQLSVTEETFKISRNADLVHQNWY